MKLAILALLTTQIFGFGGRVFKQENWCFEKSYFVFYVLMVFASLLIYCYIYNTLRSTMAEYKRRSLEIAEEAKKQKFEKVGSDNNIPEDM